MMMGIEFFALLSLALLAVLIASQLGDDYLAGMIPILLIVTNVISAKFTDVFGSSTTIGNATFVGIYLASNLLAYRGRREVAIRAINIGLFGIAVYLCLGYAATIIPSSEASQKVSNSLSVILGGAPRIGVASALAYFVSSRVNHYLFASLPASYLPQVRCFLAAAGAYFVDQVVFVSAAFVGSVPPNVFEDILLSGIAIKLCCAAAEAFVFGASLGQRRRVDS